MSKSYKGVTLKKHRVYSVPKLMVEYSVTANTVSNWVGEGLRPSDAQRPYLFRGAVVQEFHKRKRLGVRRKQIPGQFQCRGCQNVVVPRIETVVDFISKNGKHMYSAECTECSSKLQKISSKTDRDLVEDCRNPNTPTNRLHEEERAECGDTWISEEIESQILWFHNDRILFDWLGYAGRYDVKTTDSHLAAIRYFENILDGKPFKRITVGDVSKVRDDLKRRATLDAPDSLSASSIKHIASHLRMFLDWLMKQDGFKRLPKDASDHLNFPRAILASAAQVKQKEFPTILEAENLLSAMPFETLVDQRTRALFALPFLGALRPDTLVSLRIEHFDIEKRRIVQDGRVGRAKAGKSFEIVWFPVPKVFEVAVIDWAQTLRDLGYRDDDALFPHVKFLKHRPLMRESVRKPVPVMSTYHVATKAFEIACRNSKVKYTPHAAKHTIAGERNTRSLTQLQRAALSANMGHANERITEQHYGKLSDDRRIEVMESIGEVSKDAQFGNSEEEIVAIVKEVLARFKKH